MSYRIARIGLSDDLRAICAQLQSANGAWDDKNEKSDYDESNLELYLKAGHRLVVAYDGKLIVGASLASELLNPDGKNMLYVHELDSVAVYRRKGVGTAIMNEMFKIAAERRLDEIWLTTDNDNIAGNALYTKLKPYEVKQSVIYSYKVND